MYELLDWDSQFFGFQVARLTTSFHTLAELNEILSKMYAEGINLIYLTSKIEIASQVNFNPFYRGALVDKKIRFLKNAVSHADNFSIIPYDEVKPMDEKIIDLAIQSGIYSRFKIDPSIDNDKFQELYSLWIKNSINKTIAKEVLVYVEKQNIVGLVTLSIKCERADIGILAVDHLHRKKGIARCLINEAETWAIKKSLHQLQVVTQGQNLPACKLYENCNFKIETVEFIYHLWKN